MSQALRVLIVEDSEDDAALLLRELRHGGYDPIFERVETPEAMRAALERQIWEIVIADYALPQFSAPAALTVLQEQELDLPFIIVSGTIDEETAVAALRAGAHDFIVKGHLARLIPAIQRELREVIQRRARWQAELALREREQLFHKAFDESAIGMAIASTHVAYPLKVNRAMCEFLGYTEEELLRRTIASVSPSQDWEQDFALTRRLLAGDFRSYQLEKRYLHAAGHVVWGLLHLTLAHDEAGQPLYFLAQIQDITARKQTEAALRRQTERLQALHAIDQAILALQTPEAIAAVVLQYLRQLLPCQHARVVLLAADTQPPSVLAIDSDRPVHLDPEALWDIDALHQRQMRIVDDVRQNQHQVGLAYTLQVAGLASYIEVPLVAQDNLIGALSLAADQPAAFGSDHQDFIRQVADQLAVALQNAQLFAQIRAGRTRLELLSRRLLDAQETERHHIARELHDEIGQALTAVQVNVHTVLSRIAKAQRPDLATFAKPLDECIILLDQVLQQVRSLSLDLRPVLLDDLGLIPALRWFLERQAEWAGFTAQLVADSLPAHLPKDIEITCFRIVQEAVTNVVRHARARTVQIGLWQSALELHLEICDDGVGFDVATAQAQAMMGTSLGMLGLQERALLVGGKLTIESAAGRGTMVRAQLPLSDMPLERRQRGGR